MLTLTSCYTPDDARLEQFSQRYIELSQSIDLLVPGYLDFDTTNRPTEPPPDGLDELEAKSEQLIGELSELTEAMGRGGLSGDETANSRRALLMASQLRALAHTTRRLRGGASEFRGRAEAEFGFPLPEKEPAATKPPSLAMLDELLPGKGALAKRYQNYNRRFLIPRDRLLKVMHAALDECRRQSQSALDAAELPSGEVVELELTEGHPWAAYHYYEGNYRSRIAINRDFEFTVADALEMICHESYAGHHLWHVLQEETLVHRRGWKEFRIHSSSTPRASLEESVASAGMAEWFPFEERARITRERLLPLVGLESEDATQYFRARQLVEELEIEIATAINGYLSGELPRYRAIEALKERALVEDPRPLLMFADSQGPKVLSYTWGKRWVRRHFQEASSGGLSGSDDWGPFVRDLVVSLALPSGLVDMDELDKKRE